MSLLIWISLVIIPMQSQAAAIDITTCGKNKGCFTLPEDCLKTNQVCTSVATWTNLQNTISFEMSTKGSNRWVALGIHQEPVTNRMSPASVMDCIGSSSGVRVGFSRNQGLSNTEITGPGINVVKTESVDGEVRCFFTRDKNVSAGGIPDIGGSNAYTILLAHGDTDTSGKKLQHDKFVSSDTKVNFEAAGIFGGSQSNMALIKAHGSLMIFAWVWLSGTAIMLARYYKDMWPGKNVPVYEKPIWFSFHVICNTLAMLCTVCGFIIIFSYKKGWSYLSSDSPILKSHPYLGIVVTACAILNPIMALFRPHPGAPRRIIFNYCHWAVGTVAQVVGILMIFAGLRLSTTSSIYRDWMVYLLIAFVILHFLVDVCLELLNCFKSRNKREEYELGNPNDPQPRGANQPYASTIRTGLFVLFFLCALGTTLALVIGMGSL